MAPPELDPLEEDYVSEEDSDFAPEDDHAPAAEESSASGDEDEDATAKPTAKRKRPAGDDAAEDAGFENSGDEAIISKGLKKKKRKQTKEDPEDEGGEGGLIKTRAQRAVEKAEKKAAVSSGPVTIDVDALWAQMTSETAPQPPPLSQDEKQQEKEPKNPAEETALEKDLIKIKRTYNFAGKVHAEEKLVHRDSAEAKLYFAEQAGNTGDNESEEPSRKLKKAFRSVFEPVMPIDPVTGQRRSDLNLGVASRLKARELAAAKAKKLNTVEKSRMDWAGFVDKEGIKDELELAGKSKDSYAARQDFLARSEALREEEARRARMAGKV
ncbi:bucentaur or craniofacial development-domain-containing protein [Triangularia setosa]|uniref:SWR1-complex protein 5 n=1 Tax=Triangularia setosa TaxID=2587417 RepID=A0AAN6W382_9PEZI|nr:bucentaur or craniofacial development-domain-containing protein [Podospora setosa]